MTNASGQIDVLAIGAHPDDAEGGAGGFLCAAKAKGKKTGIICISDGSGGARGSSEQRKLEAKRASEILDADTFAILGQIDTNISTERVWAEKLEELLVRFKPRLILTHSPADWNPDHRNTSLLVDQAWALANRQGRHGREYLSKPMLLQFSLDLLRSDRPQIIVDISPYFKQKKHACAAHESQAEIIERLLDLNRFWGSLIGTDFAEAFSSPEPICITPELALL